MTAQVLEQTRETTEDEPFDINTLDGIDFPKDGEIIIDSSLLTKIDSETILQQNGILLESDSPKKIVIFAKKTEQDIGIGIMANMGVVKDTSQIDVAGISITKLIHTEENLPLIYTITRIESLRNGIHKYNHSEMQVGNLLEDPNLSEIFAKLVDILTLDEVED